MVVVMGEEEAAAVVKEVHRLVQASELLQQLLLLLYLDLDHDLPFSSDSFPSIHLALSNCWIACVPWRDTRK